MRPMLNRLERLGVWTRFGLVALLPLVQVAMTWFFSHLGIIWTPALLGIVLGGFVLPGRLALITSALSAASLLAGWYLLPGSAAQGLVQPLLSEAVQVLFFVGVMAVLVQVAGRKQRLLRAVAEGTEDYVYMVDGSGTITYVNEVAAQELGYERHELVGRPFTAVTPAWSHGDVWELLRAALTWQRPRKARLIVLTRTGEELTISVRIRAFTDNGRPQVLGIGRNITETQRTERLFTAAFESSPDPAVVRDREGRILACNEAYARSLGRSKAELAGLTLPPYGLSPDQLPGWAAACTATQPTCGDAHVAGGRTIRVSSTPILDDRGVAVASLTTVPDVTRVRDAESRLVQAAQLAAVGQVAAGAAHNINNVLAAISVSAELLNLDAAALGPIVAKDILAAVERGSAIVKRLYRLAGRGDRARLELLPAGEAFRGLLQIVEPQFARKGIAVVQEGPADVLVLADANLLGQVLMNLVINALHAMNSGGTLTLRVREHQTMVDLEVSDTGHGIAPEYMDRLFTPFFTTKTSDMGTGLGLSTSLQMVRAMHGEILVESAVGGGSTFTVRLPAAPRRQEE